MFAEFSLAHKSLFARVLACLLCVVLTVALCPLQGWSEESGLAPDQLTEVVPMAQEAEPSQLTKSVPLEKEPEVPQLTKAVPLAAEPEPSKAPEETKPAKVIFVISEPTATWPDSTTDDIIVEVPIGECLGDLIPPTPVSSDDSLVFEGWQTEDFETIDEEALRKRTIEGDAILYAVFSSKSAGGQQRAEPVELIASGTFGTCDWTIRGTSTTGTLTIKAGTLGDFEPDWMSFADRITSVVVNQGVKMGEYTGSLFCGCYMVDSITGLNNLDTSQATSMQDMFSGCPVLVSLNLSSWDVSNVTNMYDMFAGCTSLESVGDLSKWNTSSVTNMYEMFYGCNSLESVGDLSKWNVSNVTDMWNMFGDCGTFVSLDLSSWDVSNVKNMNGMFAGCYGLKSVGDLSKWNTSSVTDMYNMFSGCNSLESVGDLSKWNTSSVTDMCGMFFGCLSLSFDLLSWDVSNVTDMSYMFDGCSSLTSLNISSWNTSNVTDMNYMFCGCSNLTSLNISSWNTSNVVDMRWMFRDCQNLTSLDASSWDTSKVKDMDSMFYGCNSLKVIPASLTFGATTEANRKDIFKVTSGGPVVTTYSGSNTDVKNYDWPADNRALYGTPLSGTVNLTLSGNTLTATPALDDPCRNAALNYRWYRSANADGTGTVDTGITTQSYTATAADKGTYFLCKVTDGLGAYEGTISSKGVVPVKGSFTATVELSGTAKVDSALTATVTNPSSGVVPFTYKWYRSSMTSGGTLVATTSTNSYPLQDADKGMFVSCEVSVADTTAWTGSIRSGWSARVLKDFSGTVSIDGSMLTGSILTANASGNVGSETLSYRWYRSSTNSGNGEAISGAIASTYKQTDADRNQYLSCVVSVANTTAWTGSIRSDWKGPSLTTFTAGVSLSGTTVVGQPLKANVSDPNASSYSFKWQRADNGSVNWADIPSATADTYELVQDDFGKIVRCVVAASVAGYTREVASGATAAIQGVLDGKVSVSGNLYANQKLTASVKDLSLGATAAYRWYIATNAAGTEGKTLINGATADELDLSPLRAQVVGKYIVCEVYDSSNAYVNAVSSSAVGPIGIAWGTSGPNAGGCVWTIDAAGAMTIAPAANGQGSLGELKASSAPWDGFVAQVKSASIASGVKSGASLAGMFGSCSQMTSVDLTGLDATDATDLSSMFYACGSLSTIKGLAALNVAKPANLGSMFYGCSKLTTLDLSGLAAGTAADLSAMFWGCSKLSDLKLPAGFVGEKCKTVVNMFYSCNALATIPPEFGFGSNKSIQTVGCFTATGSYNAGNLLATTYLGDDVRVASYDWKGSNRSLVVWKLSGEATIAGGDDPVADNELTASATFTGPAAGLEEGATYQWYTATSADDANPQLIDKATSATYFPRKADLGKFLVCLVSAPKGSGAQGTLRAATAKAVRAPQVWATVPSRTQVYVDSQGRASVPTTSVYALGALDSEGKVTEGDIQLVGVTLTLGDASYPGGSWTLGTPGDDKIKASTFIENKAFATPGTACTVADAPAIAPGSRLPLEWEASFKNDIGPKLTSLLTAADGEGARYGEVEFKVAWKPRA